MKKRTVTATVVEPENYAVIKVDLSTTREITAGNEMMIGLDRYKVIEVSARSIAVLRLPRTIPAGVEVSFYPNPL